MTSVKTKLQWYTKLIESTTLDKLGTDIDQLDSSSILSLTEQLRCLSQVDRNLFAQYQSLHDDYLRELQSRTNTDNYHHAREQIMAQYVSNEIEKISPQAKRSKSVTTGLASLQVEEWNLDEVVYTRVQWREWFRNENAKAKRLEKAEAKLVAFFRPPEQRSGQVLGLDEFWDIPPQQSQQPENLPPLESKKELPDSSTEESSLVEMNDTVKVALRDVEMVIRGDWWRQRMRLSNTNFILLFRRK